MEIILQQLMPDPLASIQHAENSIWGTTTVLKQGRKIMLNASSGKGKSTFTSVLMGLRKDYQGTILYDGKDTMTYSPEEWVAVRREKIAVVFQDLQLFPELTVKENLLLKNKLTNALPEQKIKEYIEELQIGSKWEQRCGLLSMGQQQRVAIIRALCQPFHWLLMDEPFSHIDSENAQRCLKLINRRCDEEGAGFVLTTLGDTYQFNYDQELKL